MVAVPRLSLGPGEKKGDQALFKRCLVATVQKWSTFYTGYGVGQVIKRKAQWLGIKGDYLSEVDVILTGCHVPNAKAHM